MKLNPNHISRIQTRIGLELVYYTDIRAELIDHIACKIETEINREDEFEDLLRKTLTEIDPRKFQRQLLMQAHLNSLKEFLVDFSNLRILVKTIGITFIIGSFINLFSTYTPETAEKALKTAFLIACYSGFILGLWKNKYLRNSQVLTIANILFLTTSFSQFFLRLEWLAWTGASHQQLLFFMTACFSFILCSGYANLFRRIKKVQWD